VNVCCNRLRRPALSGSPCHSSSPRDTTSLASLDRLSCLGLLFVDGSSVLLPHHFLVRYRQLCIPPMLPHLPTTYEAYFSQPALIHPTLHLHVNGSTAPSINNDSTHPPWCSLCTTVYMNDRLFVDPFELEERWGPRDRSEGLKGAPYDVEYPTGTVNRTSFRRHETTRLQDSDPESSDPTTSIRWTLDPETPDLERPVRYQFKRKLPPPERTYNPQQTLDNPDHPYEAALRVSRRFPTLESEIERDYDLDIPTHMRYQEPSTSDDGYRIVTLGDIATPGKHEKDLLLDVFWVCDEGGTEEASGQPAHQIPITRFSLAPPSADRAHQIALPTAIASHVGYVPPLTFIVVLLSWLYIMRALFRLWRKSQQVKIR
jgi:hypothetical protein